MKVMVIREEQDKTRKEVSSPKAVDELVGDELRSKDREHFLTIHLNTKNRVIGIETTAIGTLNHAAIHQREIFKAAILNSASSIIIVHNHPSGDINPSGEDLAFTRKLVEAGELLGIPVIDHIIIGDTYLSFKENGFM